MNVRNSFSKWLLSQTERTLKHTRCFNFQFWASKMTKFEYSHYKTFYRLSIHVGLKSKMILETTMRKCSFMPVVVGVEFRNWNIVMMWSSLTNFWLRTKVFSQVTVIETNFGKLILIMTFRLSIKMQAVKT